MEPLIKQPLKYLCLLTLIGALLLTYAVMPTYGATDAEAKDTDSPYYLYADYLSEIDIFRGTSGGYELYRAPSRLEALVILIRLLGAEEAALDTPYGDCPFTDVPSWGQSYVAYAYNHQLTKGISPTRFGSLDYVSADAFITFMLRAIGYDDSQGDFNWSNATGYAFAIDMIDMNMVQSLESQSLVRGHVAKIVYDTLKTKEKASMETLAESLISQGVIPHTLAYTIHVVDSPEVIVTEPDTTTSGAIEGDSSKDQEPAPDDTPSQPETQPEPPIVETPDTEPPLDSGEQPIEETPTTDAGETDSDTETPNPVTGTSLLGEPTATMATLESWARSKGMIQEGIDLIPIYYEICASKGLNPVIQYIQMCHETGFLYKVASQAGLDASYHNPCGLKVAAGGGNYDPNAHYRFDTWYDGIDAHTDHTALYAGLAGYPRTDTKDPRHFTWLFGTGDTVEAMAMRWVGKTTETDDGVYASKLLKLYKEVLNW